MTAEGVESQAQLDILQHYDCEEAQGYFLDRPMQPALLRSALERLEQGV